MKKFLSKIECLSTKVYKQLSEPKEEDFQTALGIEFRKNKIDYIREAGLEVFYDNHPKTNSYLNESSIFLNAVLYNI